MYAIKSNITPPQVDKFLSLPDSLFNLPYEEIVGIDYVSDGLVARNEMKPLSLFNRSEPIEQQGQPEIKQLVEGVRAEKDAVVYAFGHRYDQRSPRNAAWGFQPDDGIHNIHMNQGNARGNHDDENGRGEDGALFVYFPNRPTWYGVYVAFRGRALRF